MLNNKPQIAISACLLGHKVRYDGKEKKLPVEQFPAFRHFEQVEFIPFCPEVGIGLGVPRAKIQLVREQQQIRLLGVENHRWDGTEELSSYAQNFLQQYPDINCYVVKSKSPSCGYQSTALFVRKIISDNGDLSDYEQAYEQLSVTSGLFVQTILQLRPRLLIMDEIQFMQLLNSGEQACLKFIQQLDVTSLSK